MLETEFALQHPYLITIIILSIVALIGYLIKMVRHIFLREVSMDKESILRELEISVSDEKKDKQYIEKLNRTKDKVKYLRFVKGYTQKKAAEMIGITERQIRRIEKQLKMSEKCPKNVS